MAAINKIATNSPSRQNPSELENAIAGALFDLESNTQDLKANLRPLQFTSAREVRIAFVTPIELFRNHIAREFRRAGLIGEKRWIYCGHCGIASISQYEGPNANAERIGFS
jgi:hypothetical protein